MKKSLRVILPLTALCFIALGTAQAEQVYTLYAGQNINVGTVTVSNDVDYLYVTYDLTGDWELVETHVHVATSPGDIPQTQPNKKGDGGGNPIPGHFSHCEPPSDPQTQTYTIDLDWAAGTPLYIAAHAKVRIADDSEEQHMNVYSDGDGHTMVTSGNVPAAIYPYPAADAWEPWSDTDPSVWDLGVSHSFSLGDWIWESYQVVNGLVSETVSFENAFTVPGLPIGGTLYITADDEYSVSLNGGLVGSDVWPNWPSVESYSILPLEGDNVLEIIATNSNLSGANPNPGGLIFEADISFYEYIYESAWAATGIGTEAFPGANWATYISYVVRTADLIPCPLNYPGPIYPPGGGYVIFQDLGGTNNLGVTVVLEDVLPSTEYDIYLGVDTWGIPGKIGTIMTDAGGDYTFSASVPVSSGTHTLNIDIVLKGTGADIYELPDIHDVPIMGGISMTFD